MNAQRQEAPTSLRLAAPTLRVRDLGAALRFYEEDLGLKKRMMKGASDGLELVGLGFPAAADPLLILKHDPAAAAPRPDSAGLYHYAVLLPGRRDLASTFLAVGSSGVAYDGYADHSFSEAVYLHDPELNGIELYADRPRSAWPDLTGLSEDPGRYQRFSSLNGPLDLRSLLGELTPGERARPVPFPSGARIGHMHLRVTDLERSVEFYRSKLGLDVTMYLPEIGAAFLSMDGYHHHLGLNTWQSEGGHPHRAGEAGLEGFRMALASADDVAAVARRFPGLGREEDGDLRVEDPDGIPIALGSRA